MNKEQEELHLELCMSESQRLVRHVLEASNRVCWAVFQEPAAEDYTATALSLMTLILAQSIVTVAGGEERSAASGVELAETHLEKFVKFFVDNYVQAE